MTGSKFIASTGQRRRNAVKENPRDQKPDPDDEAEQADEVDRGELAEPLLPQRAEVREDADREEGQDEEDHAKGVGFADRGRNVLGNVGRRSEREVEAGDKRDNKADDEFGKRSQISRSLALSRSGVALMWLVQI